MLNHDAAHFLLAARALDDGRALYKSFADLSMPAATWMALVSLQFAKIFDIPLFVVHKCFLVFLTLDGALVTGFVIGKIAGPGTYVGRWMPSLLIVLFLVCPYYDLGQRDVLFAALIGPLVALLAGRHLGFAPPFGLSLCIVVLAALGSSLKPHTALPLLVLGLSDFTLWRGKIRSVAPELWGLAALLLLYIIAVQVLYPSYFWQVLPSAGRTYLSLGQSIASTVLTLIAVAGCGTFSAVAASIPLRCAVGGSVITKQLLLACVPFGGSLAAVYVLQRQGFEYQAWPFVIFTLALAFLFLLIALDLGLAKSGPNFSLNRRASVMAVSALIIELSFLANYWMRSEANLSHGFALADPVTQQLQSQPSGTYVFALQTGVPPINPLQAYANVRWSGEFDCLYEIAAIERDYRSARISGRSRDPFFVTLEEKIRAAAFRSITVRPPALVLVDVSPHLRWFEHLGEPFSILDWLKHDPSFAQAWSSYEYVKTVSSLFETKVAIFRRRSVAWPRRVGPEVAPESTGHDLPPR